MNHQPFTNVQFEKFKKILSNSIIFSIKLELRKTTGEKTSFDTVKITQAVLFSRKILDKNF